MTLPGFSHADRYLRFLRSVHESERIGGPPPDHQAQRIATARPQAPARVDRTAAVAGELS